LPKQLLTPTEINQLIILLKDVFTYISNLKDGNPLASDIQYPKLPPRLTESLAIHLLRRGLIPELKGCDFHFGGKEADIIGARGAEKFRIEVKGTTKGFEYFGEKDIRANYLMWFDFEELFRKGDIHFMLCVLPHRESRFSRPVKITIAGLKKLAQDDVEWRRYNSQDLLDRLITSSLNG